MVVTGNLNAPLNLIDSFAKALIEQGFRSDLFLAKDSHPERYRQTLPRHLCELALVRGSGVSHCNCRPKRKKLGAGNLATNFRWRFWRRQSTRWRNANWAASRSIAVIEWKLGMIASSTLAQCCCELSSGCSRRNLWSNRIARLTSGFPGCPRRRGRGGSSTRARRRILSFSFGSAANNARYFLARARAYCLTSRRRSLGIGGSRRRHLGLASCGRSGDPM